MRHVALPTLATTPPAAVGTPLRVTGWGRSDGTEMWPIDLQQTDVSLIACGPNTFLDAICTRKAGSSCAGDTGGPLTINRGRGYTELVGLLAIRGGPCGGTGVHTNIAHPEIRSFIDSIVVQDGGNGFTSRLIWAREEALEDGALVPDIILRRTSAEGRLELDLAISQSGRPVPRVGPVFLSDDIRARAKVVFEAGSLTGRLSFLIADDEVPEPNEAFTITLLGAPAGWNTRATVIIADDDDYRRPVPAPLVVGSAGP